MKKIVVITSGGMDSAVLLKWHHNRGELVRALAINYGQRHKMELKYAQDNAIALDVPFALADFHTLGSLLPGSSQTDESIAVPHGRYDEDSMKATVVPNRNMILLSVAIGVAIAHKFDAVSYAAHAGDHAIYPDCRPEFVEALSIAAALCDWHPVKIDRPFIEMSKAGIVKVGQTLGVDFANTYSCYEGRPLHCGVCGTCIERREAFYLAEVKDPTRYDTNAPSVETLIKRNWKP